MAFESFLARQIGNWLVNKAINLPKEIRDPLPTNATGLDKFLQASGRRLCDQWARVAPVARLIPQAPQFDVVCYPYLSNTNQAPTTPAKSVPVSSKDGGQCADVKYKSYLKFRTFTINAQTGQYTWYPVTETSSDPSLPGNPALWGPTKLDFVNTGSSQTYIWKGKYNSEGANAGIGVGPSDGGIVLLDAWVQRVDGQSDDCGVPDNYTPPEYPPLPPLPPVTVNAPYTDNRNWDIQINNDGTVNFCMNNSCNQIPAPGDPPPAPAEDPGKPYGKPSQTNPQTQTASGCVEAGYVLTGIKITIKTQPESAVNARWGFYKSAGWVRFGPSSTLLTVSGDIVWLADGMFVTPPNEYCTCYQVKSNSTWQFLVQAYAKKKQSQSAL